MEYGISHLEKWLLIYMLIPICAQFLYTNRVSPYVNFFVSLPICIWRFPSSICVWWSSYSYAKFCIWGSISRFPIVCKQYPYAYGLWLANANPHMHMGINVNPRIHTGIVVVESLYAYGDNVNPCCMHSTKITILFPMLEGKCLPISSLPVVYLSVIPMSSPKGILGSLKVYGFNFKIMICEKAGEIMT